MTSQMVPVIQVDRDAAAEFVSADYGDEGLANEIRGGEAFEGLAKAFAKHRLSTTEALREALGWFVADERFHVSVGGNPKAVEQMIAEAQARYAALEGAVK